LEGSGGNYERAYDLLNESFAVMRQVEAAWPTALSIMSLGQVALARGDLTGARDRFDEAMIAAKQEGKRRITVIVQSGLADVERRSGHYAEAKAMYRDTLMWWNEFQNRGAVARCMECLAFVAASEGDANGESLQAAATLLGAAEKIRETSSDMTTRERDEYASELAVLRKRLNPDALEAGWSRGRAMEYEAATAFALGDGAQI
ncbi:MAG: tetratricopeptide repeat protein, partial [Rudaea sp.]